MATTPLQRELRQTRPFDSAAQEATLGLVRTADQLRRHFSSVVEPHGITVQQFNVLRILRGASPEALPTLEIAERMVEQTPGVTRLLDRLEAKRLITRARCPNDRRQVLCGITPQAWSFSLNSTSRFARPINWSLACCPSPRSVSSSDCSTASVPESIAGPSAAGPDVVTTVARPRNRDTRHCIDCKE